MLAAGVCYWLGAVHPAALVLVVVCLALNWFGDSLDGTLARVRRQGRYEVFDEGGPEVEPFATRGPDGNPERQAFSQELRGLLEWAIDRLPNGMREVFVLRDVEGLSTLETAECLGVSEDVVKTRLSRGRALLRQQLMERTGASAPEAKAILSVASPRGLQPARHWCCQVSKFAASPSAPGAKRHSTRASWSSSG